MRIDAIAIVTIAALLAGCATAKIIPPAGISNKQEAADRAQCDKVGEASRSDPKMKQYVEDNTNGGMVGSAIGGGLIGLAVAANQQDKTRENWAKVWVATHTRDCLFKKGYKVEGA